MLLPFSPTYLAGWPLCARLTSWKESSPSLCLTASNKTSMKIYQTECSINETRIPGSHPTQTGQCEKPLTAIWLAIGFGFGLVRISLCRIPAICQRHRRSHRSADSAARSPAKEQSPKAVEPSCPLRPPSCYSALEASVLVIVLWKKDRFFGLGFQLFQTKRRHRRSSL